MTSDQILTDLKNKVYHPVYFLMGEEPYYIDVITDYIAEHVLDEAEKSFNQSILYGKETDVSTIISEAKRFPMMGTHQVVIVKEAQNLKNIEQLASYLEQPLRSTLLVIAHKYKTIDKRKAFAKQIAKNAVLFESSKLYEDKIPAWITSYLKTRGYQIDSPAAALLTEYLGNDLGKVANELEKLTINIAKNTQITKEHIQQNIGISKDYNVFELQNALGRKDVLKSNQIINYFAANTKDNPLILTIITLFSFFTKVILYHVAPDKSKNSIAATLKVNPYFVRDYEIAANNYSRGKLAEIISILREFDLKSKGVDSVSVSEGELMKEMVFRILH